MYLYVKALHIIFVVTWFSGLFYMVRLFIYNREAIDKPEPERTILNNQFQVMIKRLWFGITWPSCILTLIFGGWMWMLMDATPSWLIVKLFFVVGLLAYHGTLQILYKQQSSGRFIYSSQQLRIWNEVASLFLVAIVMVAVVKSTLSWIGGVAGLIALAVLLMTAIRIYKFRRSKMKR